MPSLNALYRLFGTALARMSQNHHIGLDGQNRIGRLTARSARASKNRERCR